VTAYDVDINVTAWYLPTGPIVNPPPPPAIIDDAFSALKGGFIDDYFVTVTPDDSSNSLTQEANVVGIVPSATDEALQAYQTVVSTHEPFFQWVSVDAGATKSETLNVPAGSDGIAIAVYQYAPNPRHDALFEQVTYSVMVDGGGSQGVGSFRHPVPPLGYLQARIADVLAVTVGSRSMPSVGTTIRRLAAQSALAAIRAVIPRLQRQAETGEE
jgi:hypothetical protein